MRVSCLTLGAVVLTTVVSGGCIPSNIVAPEQREVVAGEPAEGWHPAKQEELLGAWDSWSFTGALAGSLMRLHYWFEDDGRFAGSALFLDTPPEYAVLSGEWSFDEEGRLVLGEDIEPAVAEATRDEHGSDWLRLSGSDGRVHLRRSELR